MEERRAITKLLYKVELIILKFIPMVLALMYFFNTILPYFNIDTRVLNYLGGLSLIPMIFLYVSSYVFKFCFYHRIFLHYIVINYIISVYDEYIGIPLDNYNYVVLNCLIMFIVIAISNITESDANEIIECLTKYTQKDRPISKYEACVYLGLARSTFDKYVANGIIPKGKHRAGFKELYWIKKDLDDVVTKLKHK